MKLLIPIKIDDNTALLIEFLKKLHKEFLQCEMIFLHVLKPEDIRYDLDANTTIRQHYKETYIGHQLLERVMQALIDSGVASTDMIRKGVAHEVIMAEAERLNVDMIVLGSKERSTFIDLIRGSVKLKILQETKIPVLVYPQD
jgi:nucleotide-binding universal stress UspA family protein